MDASQVFDNVDKKLLVRRSCNKSYMTKVTRTSSRSHWKVMNTSMEEAVEASQRGTTEAIRYFHSSFSTNVSFATSKKMKFEPNYAALHFAMKLLHV